MRNACLAILLVAIGAAACAAEHHEASSTTTTTTTTTSSTSMAAAPANAPLRYPVARKGDVVDDYFGTKVPDPYRWLEDPDSPETRAWIATENSLTFGFLSKIPQRDAIKKRLTDVWNYEKYSAPFVEGGRYFWTKNDGLQAQSVLWVADKLDGTPWVLLDPNKLSADGTVALSGISISDDGKKLAYSLSTAGSDWQEWHVRDVDSGKDTADVVKWSKFSGASWAHDGSGFYYSRYDAPKAGQELEQANYFQKLYFHKLGDDQAKDALIYQRPDEKEWGFGGSVTDDGRWLIISIWKGTSPKNQVYYQDLSKKGSKILPLVDKFEAEYSFLDDDGETFWFKTNQDAPRGKIIAIDVKHPTVRKEVVPQSADTIEGVGLVGGKFFVSYLHDAHSAVKMFALDGKPLGELALPGIGSAGGFGGKRTDKETFYAYTSFTEPGSIYRYDVASGASTLFKKPQVPFDASGFETEQVFYESKDGTKIPMFLVHKKGIALDGNNPTFLYGYGGFDISLTPSFSPSILVWLEMGGMFAQPNLRGGGEYGEDWHLAGTRTKKQNVFDDFASAAQWLIDHRYTSTPKLAIGGGSNGGLLIGASITQHPELFGCALPQVGVMDMLRFQKFTIGWAWKDDYGASDESKEMFDALFHYSPLHNVKPGTKYPPTLLTTGDHDDRVVPAHTFKFTATLQAAQAADGPPVLVRIETRAGHGAGKPTAKIIEEAADRWAFAVKELGMNPTLTVGR